MSLPALSSVSSECTGADVRYARAILRAGFGFHLNGWSLTSENGALLVRDPQDIAAPRRARTIAAALSYMVVEGPPAGHSEAWERGLTYAQAEAA